MALYPTHIRVLPQYTRVAREHSSLAGTVIESSDGVAKVSWDNEDDISIAGWHAIFTLFPICTHCDVEHECITPAVDRDLCGPCYDSASEAAYRDGGR